MPTESKNRTRHSFSLARRSFKGAFANYVDKTSTQGDLSQIFPTFSNPILYWNFYIKVDSKSTYMSNIQQNSVELCTNLRFCHQAAEFEKTSKITKL